MVSNSDLNTLPTLHLHDFLPPLSRWMKFSGLLMMGAIGAAVAIASVAQYRMAVKASAIIRPAGEVRLVQAATEGTVIQIDAAENQLIHQGEIIARLDDSRLQTKKRQLQDSIRQAHLQILQIAAQTHALNSQIAAETDRHNRAVASTEAELQHQLREYHDRQKNSRMEVKEAEASLKAATATWNTAQLKVQRYRPVVESGALALDRLDEAKLAVQQQQQEVAAAQAKLQRSKTALNPSNAEVAIAIERIAQEKATGKATIAALRKEQQALIQQQLQLQNQLSLDVQELKQIETDLSKTMITATADGIIAKLILRNPGQTIQSGTEIAQIVPGNTPLVIKALVTAQDISKVSVGQKTQLRISACPYPDYGTLSGNVKNISPDAKASASQGSPMAMDSANQLNSAGTPYYEVTIAPERHVLQQGNRHCSIQVGMEGRVDILSGEDTVLRTLLRKARLLAEF